MNSDNSNTIIGGEGGDKMFGSDNRDVFIYQGASKAALIAETGLNSTNRDYIANFSQGDTIVFAAALAKNVQFLGNGSGNASQAVAAGDFGLSIRYDKGVNLGTWDGVQNTIGTKISIDVADANGVFDNVPDATIMLVGQNIDINVVGNSIVFGA